jgi:hypothetical protein
VARTSHTTAYFMLLFASAKLPETCRLARYTELTQTPHLQISHVVRRGGCPSAPVERLLPQARNSSALRYPDAGVKVARRELQDCIHAKNCERDDNTG